MAGAKLVVLYPYPQDVVAFERAYTEEHAPMVNENNMKGITKFVATKVVATPDGSAPPFYRIAELHFPSLKALQEAASSASAQKGGSACGLDFQRRETTCPCRRGGHDELLRQSHWSYII
jgi:uncharacterized protein (TIGR02118 family)